MPILLTKEERGHYTDGLADLHHQSDYWSDWFPYWMDPYLEVADQRKNLVICYGDSWTWGESLGSASALKCQDDVDARLANLYGRHVADRLEADWVNCAHPGIMNYWVHDRLCILVDNDIIRLSERYDNIWIIVTLTELGRDFEFEKYQKEFESFVDLPCSGDEILSQAEKFDFTKLRMIEERLPQNCRLIVGRNFTNTYPANQNHIRHLLPESWVNLLLAEQNLPQQTDVRMMSFGIDKFLEWATNKDLVDESFKIWIANDVSSKANKLLDLLDASCYNNDRATKHPNPDGHKIWAEYLIDYIRKLN